MARRHGPAVIEHAEQAEAVELTQAVVLVPSGNSGPVNTGGNNQRGSSQAYIPESPEPEVLDAELVEKADDLERGTSVDWLSNQSWGSFYDDPSLIVGRSERIWVSEVTEMLDRSGQANAVEKALALPLRQANLTIEKPDKDKGQTEFVREVLYSSGAMQGMVPDLVQIVAQMTWAISVRRTYHEIVWSKRADGKFVYSKIAWRPPATCEPVRDRKTGDLRGFRQFVDPLTAGPSNDRLDTGMLGSLLNDGTNAVNIPANRALIYIHGQHRDPVNGITDLGVTHWAYTMQQRILMLWATFLDAQAQPKVIAYGDSTAAAQANARAIASLRGSGVLGMKRDLSRPDAKVFDLLETSGKGADQFQAMITYLEHQMAQSVLAGFLDLTGGASRGAGSYALSADQSGLFLNSRQSVAKELSAVVTQQLIAPLVRVNFGSDAAVPRLVFEKMSADQNDKAMQMLQQIGSAQNTSVPAGFLDLLIERVAQFLDLPDEKVEAVLAEAADQRRKLAEAAGREAAASQTPQGQLSDTIGGAQDLVQKKLSGQPIGTGPGANASAPPVAPTPKPTVTVRPAPATTSPAVQAVQQHRKEKQ